MAKRKSTVRRTAADIVDGADGPIQGNDELATKVWKAWRQTRNHLSQWRPEAVECFDIVAGRQWTEDEIAKLKSDMRVPITYNRTGVVVDSVSGYEINSRQDVTFLPRENGDTGGAQVATEAAKYYRQQCDAEDEESDAFFDTLVCGIGAVEHRMDYDDDPEGMLKVERVDPLEMGYDPAATKRNLSDRRWDIRGKWWDKEVAKTTFPKFDFADAENIPGDMEDLDDSKPVDREKAPFYKDTGVGDGNDRRKDKIFILEYTWFEREPFITALNPATGKLEETTKDVVEALNDRLAAQGMEPVKSVTRHRKVYKRAFVYGRDTINPDDLDAPCPHFQYQFITGKRDRNKNVWYGLVRPMKDPQRWANKFLSQTMHMINANAKGGLIHDKGAFDDPADIEQRMAKPGFRLEKNAGYDVQPVPPTPIPNNTFELMQFSIGSGRDVTGVNLELLGMTDRDQPGVLEHSRKQSAMAILAPFFNAMRRYRKESGRITLYFIREYMSEETMIRVVGQGEAKYVPLAQAKGFDKYDVIADQSPSSPNAKETTFAALTQVLPIVAKMGAPIPPDVIDSIPGLPAQLAEAWKAMLTKGPTPQQQQAEELAKQEKLAEINKTNAEALKSEASATESIAKVIPLLQQVLAGLGMLSQAIPGGPEVGTPGAVPAPAPQPGPGPMPAPQPSPMAPPSAPPMQ